MFLLILHELCVNEKVWEKGGEDVSGFAGGDERQYITSIGSCNSNAQKLQQEGSFQEQVILAYRVTCSPLAHFFIMCGMFVGFLLLLCGFFPLKTTKGFDVTYHNHIRLMKSSG